MRDLAGDVQSIGIDFRHAVTRSPSTRKKALHETGKRATARKTKKLRQGDAKVFKKYSQMHLQMKREALQKMNRLANEKRDLRGRVIAGILVQGSGFGTVLVQFSPESE